MASLHSQPYENDEALSKIGSAFRRRMVACDFSKEILTASEKIKNADLILVDLIDERFDLVVLPEGQILTNSNELGESGLLADRSFKDYKLIPQSALERRDMWLQGMHRFLEVVNLCGKTEALVINKVFWSSRFEGDSKTKFPVSHAVIEKANKELAWMYSQLALLLSSDQFIEFDQEILTADENHRWGISPFHYSQAYYLKAFEQIIDKRQRGKINADESSQEEKNASSEKINLRVRASAYKIGPEVIALCHVSVVGDAYEAGTFAFYLMLNGVRYSERWYEKSSIVRFPIPEEPGELEIVAFYKEKNNAKTIVRVPVS